MNPIRNKPFLWALNNTSVALFILVLAVFGWLSPKFLQPGNLTHILVQSSSTAVVAVGMTFVLLTAGVDLSVGAIMFVGAAVAGKFLLGGGSIWLAVPLMLALGLACGALNAYLIVQWRIAAFIVTLGTLYLGRGLSLRITETRAMNLPANFRELGQSVAGIPVPIIVLAAVVILAHLILNRTAFGRQVYAAGHDIEAARKAGVHVGRIQAAVYLISGLCAAVGGLLSLTQLGAVSPTFGNNKEFSAIAAAVLGGTSLFGGRGQVFPGTLVGAVLIQSVDNGLVMLNANPYYYPLVTSAIIFAAVLTDSLRCELLAKLHRRVIRIEEGETETGTS